MKKTKEDYIDEVHTEIWKTVHLEYPTEVIWDSEMNCFLCENETGAYYVDYADFFKKHVIKSNVRGWGSSKNNNKKHLASWLCLINGHNMWEDCLEANTEKISRMKAKNEKPSNERNNLIEYIADRYEDALFSMENATSPEWLEAYIFERH
jgi:hypothetical protein